MSILLRVPTPHPSTIMGTNMTLPPTATTLPFQRSERPSCRSHNYNQKHMPVPTPLQRALGAAYGSLGETPDFRPQPSAGPYNVHSYQGRSSTSFHNQTPAATRTTPIPPNSSPADRTVKTAPVSKDMQSAQVPPVQDLGIPTESNPVSHSDDEDIRSTSSSPMNVDPSIEESSVKIVTSSTQVGPTLPTLKVALKRLKSSLDTSIQSPNNQSDCYIVESNPTPDSGSEHLVQESASSSPPRKLQKGDQKDE